VRVVLGFSLLVQQLQRLIANEFFAVHYDLVLLADGFSSFIGFFIAGVSLCIFCAIFFAFIGLNLCAESADISSIPVVIGNRVVPGQNPIWAFGTPGVQLKTMREVFVVPIQDRRIQIEVPSYKWGLTPPFRAALVHWITVAFRRFHAFAPTTSSC
jgi:hypothetical protein